MLAKKLGLDWQTVRRLVDVQKQSNKSLPELAQAVQQHLHKEPYTREEVAQELGISVSLKYSSKNIVTREEVSRRRFIWYTINLHTQIQDRTLGKIREIVPTILLIL